MSRVLNLRAGVDSGFPRLRGDEPVTAQDAVGEGVFSPPARG